MRLRCGVCGEAVDRIVHESMVHRLTSGGFAPLRCSECGCYAAVPVAPRWELSAGDVLFLKLLGVNGEATTS